MISTISQHKINTNCLNQYNKNFKKLSLISPKTNILKSILISLVFGKTLILGKSMESLSAHPLSSDLKKNKPFATGRKPSSKGKSHSPRQRGPLTRQKIEGQAFFSPQVLNPGDSLQAHVLNNDKVKSPRFSNDIWGLLLFSREDLAFINLRGLLSTLLKALQVCLFALFNNKRILFVGDAQPLVQEHHQRLLSCFIANQAKVFSTTIALKLPPILPSLPTGLKENVELTNQKKQSLDKKDSLSKSDQIAFLAKDEALDAGLQMGGFGTDHSQNQNLQGNDLLFKGIRLATPNGLAKQALQSISVRESLFANLHVLINTKIANKNAMDAYEFVTATNYQPRTLAPTNILSSGQPNFAKSASTKVELPISNKQESNCKKTNHSLLTTNHKSQAKTLGENTDLLSKVIRQKSSDLRFSKANAEVSMKEKQPSSLNFVGPTWESKGTTSNKNIKINDLEPTVASTTTLACWPSVTSQRPKSLENFCLAFLQSKSKQKWLGFQTYKPLFFESTKMDLGFSLKKNVKQNGQSLALSQKGFSKVEIIGSDQKKKHDTVNLRQRLGLAGTKLENKEVHKIIERTGKEKANDQEVAVSVKSNLDSNFPVSYSHFYTEMAKLISKAAIRNSQWTATLAQPTNYWIGGFFSNSRATYKPNLSSTTLLNIKMDPQCQLQQFRDLYSKSQSTRLQVYKKDPVSEKSLLDFKKPKSTLIVDTLKNPDSKSKLATRLAIENALLSDNKSIETLPSGKVKNKSTRLLPFEESAKKENFSSTYNKNQDKTDVLVKAESTVFSTHLDKRLFFEKSFFSITTALPVGNLVKLSATYRQQKANTDSETTLKGPTYLLDSISEFSGGLWSAIYAPVARKLLTNKPEAQELYTQRKPAFKSFCGQIPAKMKIFKKQKGRKSFSRVNFKGINKRIVDHCLHSIDVNKARNAWLNEADLVFFANPERNLSLLNQINRLKIPTIGIINSGSDLAFPFRSVKGPSLLSAKQTITYPIIGNSNSLNFLRIVLTKFACVLSLKRA